MKHLVIPIKLKHESGYYWGLGLMLASCLSLGWALWRDAFRPEVFLAGLVAFSWGYMLLWRHDVNLRFTALEAEITALKSRNDLPGDEVEPLEWAQELPEAITPPIACESPTDTPGATPSETQDKVEAPSPTEY